MNAYKILILIGLLLGYNSCKKTNSKNEANVIANKYVLTSGNYTGLWSSKTTNRSFTDLPVSTIIKEVAPGQYTGSFFISNNFTSCCNSGDNDGVISFNIKENILRDFKYNDIIPNCNGLFIGDGKLPEDNSIIINITGTDCDGDHTGTITLSKK
ncbi:hypothetical protein [uncultured Lutibacter sp.]|uniref:hypothetical protein n=1 Tax=uncultured Lutibacter sp. TaxID=437739 RepID=UPI002639CCA3|nr:hypothetical protein [uncultured Lutibacter sp.]